MMERPRFKITEETSSLFELSESYYGGAWRVLKRTKSYGEAVDWMKRIIDADRNNQRVMYFNEVGDMLT